MLWNKKHWQFKQLNGKEKIMGDLNKKLMN